MTDIRAAGAAAAAATLAGAVDELRTRGILPADLHAVLFAGSRLRGWGNAGSDVDVYVIADKAWDSPTSTRHTVPLRPELVSGEDIEVDGVRWDIRYLLADQVEQMFAKVSWEVFDAGQDAGSNLSLAEINFLERLGYGIAPENPKWLDSARVRLAESAFRSMLAVHRLNLADSWVEDAVGQLDAGDVMSAVLSARQAFAAAIDGLLASLGECGQNTKWRARRLVAVETDVISVADYWAVETMRGLDPDDPKDWVFDVVSRVQRISAEVAV